MPSGTLEIIDDDMFVLSLNDLVGDANGEVVLFNDSGLRTVAIETGCGVLAEGRADGHVTAGGHDVTGFRFMTFANGLRLFFESGLEVTRIAAR